MNKASHGSNPAVPFHDAAERVRQALPRFLEVLSRVDGEQSAAAGRRLDALGNEAALACESGREGEIYPCFAMLSFVNRIVNSGRVPVEAGFAEAAAELADSLRDAIGAIGAAKFGGTRPALPAAAGLPILEKDYKTLSGTILLALDDDAAEKITPLLALHGHRTLTVRSWRDIVAMFGFETSGAEASGGDIREWHRASEGGIARYSLRNAAIPPALRRAEFPDILLCDLLSAGFMGFELQEFVKGFSESIDSRILVLSPVKESKCVARAIQLGADDYLGYDVEPAVLVSRIEASIERRRLKARRLFYLTALAQAREKLEEELRNGGDYVQCLLPGKISSPTLHTDWEFIPSANLGGDLFGYQRLDDGRLAIFMIDVSGHGVQSALHSVTIFDVLRTEGIRNVDFGDPASVIRGLNHTFRMEERNNMLFTIWYGVYDEKRRTLVHSSAGSPPGILVVPGGGAIELTTGGMVAGADPDAEYGNAQAKIPRRSRLFLFSDGIYEFRRKDDGSILGLEAFIQVLEAAASSRPEDSSSVGEIMRSILRLSAQTSFPDDVSLLEMRFN